jgi:2-keto-4-pentenoate hydratase/2-oxohepta-3-ene-1,7-dioic acid hydratase in catechol pathway
MRLANLAGRAVLLTTDDAGIDVSEASGGRFGPGLPDVYADWADFRAWADSATGPSIAVDPAQLRSPSPRPSQVFAIGLNYSEHAAESGFERPDGLPPVFTKWPSAISGPVTTVVLPPGGNTDWEVELVAIIGAPARELAPGTGWDVVAGLAVGQDLSERRTQLRGPAPQFGLGKSFPGFAPIGPWLVTPDAVSDPDDLELWATVDGQDVQRARTSQLLMPVPRLVEELSRVVTLQPGDVLFTGTPSGVGLGRTPPRFLQPGETLVSAVEGIGTLRQTFVER